MTAMAGYSGKPLYQKLGLKPGMHCLALKAPDHFDALMTGVEEVDFDHAEVANGGNYDAVLLFCADEAALKTRVRAALAALTGGGMLWVCWPKKSSALFQDLTEGGVRSAVLPTGWVDVKVCAVDVDWSGLKFLKRKEKR